MNIKNLMFVYPHYNKDGNIRANIYTGWIMKLINMIIIISNIIWNNISLIMFMFSAVGLICYIAYACYVADILQYVLMMLSILAFSIKLEQLK